MNREAIIEAIAAKRWCPDRPQPCAHWLALKPRDRQECIDEVRMFWPVIVDGVAEWLQELGLRHLPRETANRLARLRQEDTKA